MAHTYSVNLLHCVFSTKGRLGLIPNPPQAWRTLAAVARNAKINVLAIGGTTNHVHMLLDLPKTRSVADVMRELKANSSARLRRSTPMFGWQDGYGAISVSPTAIQAVKRYIDEQQRHHSARTFEEEFTGMLDRAGVTYDAQYVLD